VGPPLVSPPLIVNQAHQQILAGNDDILSVIALSSA